MKHPGRNMDMWLESSLAYAIVASSRGTEACLPGDILPCCALTCGHQLPVLKLV